MALRITEDSSLHSAFFANSSRHSFYAFTEHRTTTPAAEAQTELFSKTCNCRETENSTFPVLHGPEHPLVVGVLHEDPVTTHAVRGVGSESRIHRPAAALCTFTAMLCTLSYCLKPCSSPRLLELSGSVQNTNSVPELAPCFPPYLRLLSPTFNATPPPTPPTTPPPPHPTPPTTPPALAKCLPAGSSVRERRSPQRSAGKIVLCARRPHPRKTLPESPNKPELRAQSTLSALLISLVTFSVQSEDGRSSYS